MKFPSFKDVKHAVQHSVHTAKNYTRRKLGYSAITAEKENALTEEIESFDYGTIKSGLIEFAEKIKKSNTLTLWQKTSFVTCIDFHLLSDIANNDKNESKTIKTVFAQLCAFVQQPPVTLTFFANTTNTRQQFFLEFIEETDNRYFSLLHHFIKKEVNDRGCTTPELKYQLRPYEKMRIATTCMERTHFRGNQVICLPSKNAPERHSQTVSAFIQEETVKKGSTSPIRHLITDENRSKRAINWYSADRFWRSFGKQIKEGDPHYRDAWNTTYQPPEAIKAAARNTPLENKLCPREITKLNACNVADVMHYFTKNPHEFDHPTNHQDKKRPKLLRIPFIMNMTWSALFYMLLIYCSAITQHTTNARLCPRPNHQENIDRANEVSHDG